MKIGKMDRRVVIEHRNTTRDEYGQVGPEYTTTATIWADVIYRGSPREKLLDASIFPNAELAIVIRHPRGAWTPSQTMRVGFDAETYEVVGIQEIGRREGLRLFVQRVRK